MKFKVGDRVKFLNESGGGIVAGIVSPNMVNVAIQDGFEIPTLTSELIRIEEEAPVSSPKHMFREEYDIKIDPEKINEFQESDTIIPLQNNPSQGSISKGVYFALVPHDQKWLITGMLDIYLINYTPYDILYSFFREDEDGIYKGFDYGSVTPESMKLMHSVERDELVQWAKGIVQVLFHKDSANNVLNPGSSSFKIRTSRFYHENSYKSSPILSGRSILLSLLPLDAQVSIAGNDNPDKDRIEKNTVSKAREIEPEHMIDRHKTSPREAVVDLHIYELAEDSDKLSSSEMLKIQLDYFRGCLESALSNNLSKITFIHGVGKGTLKKEMYDILGVYKGIDIYDASMSDFGYGATEVLIRHNR
ncbi:MAG: DUF2027 domain-containing protein [Bacteroidales bacterium]|nr:DUF2027 domain-containing protein [Bacteroidales bacterium]